MIQFRNHSIGDVNASFARIKCSCVSLEAPASPSNGRILRRCSRWTNRPSLLATIAARPHHTVQLWRLWITVQMWTRCVCRQDVLGAVLTPWAVVRSALPRVYGA